LRPAILESGKHRERDVDEPVAGGATRSRDGEVVSHAQVREDGPSLADVTHADPGKLVSVGVIQVAALDVPASTDWSQKSAHHTERSRLSRAVRTEQRGDGAPAHGDVDAVQHLDGAVGGAYVVQGKRRRQQRNPLAGVRRFHLPPTTFMAMKHPLLSFGPS